LDADTIFALTVSPTKPTSTCGPADTSHQALTTTRTPQINISQPVRLAHGWWLVLIFLREKYCCLIASGWFVLREKYCWLVADKPSKQGINTARTPATN
jgi:hypothetical protein